MIYLDFEGTELRIRVEKESTFRSRHSGAELKRIEVSLVARGRQAHESLLEIIERAKEEGINSTDGQGNVLNRWRLRKNSHSHTVGEPEYYHSLELEGEEELKVDKLVLAGLTFQPYSYNEEFDGDALIIEAKVLLSEAQYDELTEFMKREGYFPVIRHGISDEPREMRFGATRWSKHQDGIKHELLLVEKSYDEAKTRPRFTFALELPRMREVIAEHAGVLGALLTTLVNKGLLEAEEADSIRGEASRRAWHRQRELYRVKDIDEW